MIWRTSKREMKSKEEGPGCVSVHLRNCLEAILKVTKGVSVFKTFTKQDSKANSGIKTLKQFRTQVHSIT